MASALVSGSSGPGSSPGRGHCVVFLGKTLHSHSAPGGSRNTPSRFMLQKPEISAGLMGHLARMQTLPLPNKLKGIWQLYKNLEGVFASTEFPN